MTRGKLCVLFDDMIEWSIEFNGDMYPNGVGRKALEVLRKTRSLEEFKALVEAFDDDVFGYRREFRETVVRSEKYHSIDFSEDYFNLYFSDYIYIKNLGELPRGITCRDKNVVEILPGEIECFHFGDPVDISRYVAGQTEGNAENGKRRLNPNEVVRFVGWNWAECEDFAAGRPLSHFDILKTTDAIMISVGGEKKIVRVGDYLVRENGKECKVYRTDEFLELFEDQC